MNVKSLRKKLGSRYGSAVTVRVEDGCIVVSGQLKSWDDIVPACCMCVDKKSGMHVLNDICLDGAERPPVRLPSFRDQSLEGSRPDVLIIGGGISGTSIARELSKWKLDILLVDKEADLAVQASGRNDGEVHPGVDLNKGSLKQHYVLLGNKMYDRVCRDLSA